MIYDFSEITKQNDLVEKELQTLKKEYEKPQMSAAQLEALKKRMEEAGAAEKRGKRQAGVRKLASTAAAFAAAFLILPNTSASMAYAMEQIPVLGSLVDVVTFRNYSYESERNHADIQVPEIKVEERSGAEQAQRKLAQTTEEINAEIQMITEELVSEFQTFLEEEQGYQDVIVKSEVLATTADYFTLKLICYYGSGSGYEWNYYYTIDLNTGERLKLKDVFVEGADYITPISNNIKEQMQEQMDSDENVRYWLHEDVEEWNFKSITEETSFYVSQNGNIVIGFDEGEVAPMYMGTVEFEIPEVVLGDIRK